MRLLLAVWLASVFLAGSLAATTLPSESAGGENLLRDTAGDHNVGNVVFTISDIGVQAYMDFPSNAVGSGFQYPAGSRSLLFEGALLVGVSSAQVSDAMRNSGGGQDRDFAVSPGGDLVIAAPGAQADQQGYAVYNDGVAASPIGVTVEQHSYSWVAPPNNDFVILRYVVSNTGTGTISDCYIGVYLDWDVATTATDNSNYDFVNDLGYMWANDGTATEYAGIVSLSHRPPTTFRSISNANEAYPPNPSEAAKWGWLTAGLATVSHSAEDISMVMADGPFTLGIGQSVVVGFALVGGANLPDLQANAVAAHALWPSVPVELVSLTAKGQENSVILEWSTASELDNLGFEIQHRVGGDFQYVDFVDGYGTTLEPQFYSYQVNDLGEGSHAFRLKQVDFDGTYALSPIVEAVVGLPDAYRLTAVQPNPFSQETEFALSVAQTQRVMIGLYDLSGHRVAEVFAGRIEGNETNSLTISSEDMPSGTYFLKVSGETFEASQEVMLLK